MKSILSASKMDIITVTTVGFHELSSQKDLLNSTHHLMTLGPSVSGYIGGDSPPRRHCMLLYDSTLYVTVHHSPIVYI